MKNAFEKPKREEERYADKFSNTVKQIEKVLKEFDKGFPEKDPEKRLQDFYEFHGLNGLEGKSENKNFGDILAILHNDIYETEKNTEETGIQDDKDKIYELRTKHAEPLDRVEKLINLGNSPYNQLQKGTPYEQF